MHISLLPIAVFVTAALSAAQKDLDCLTQIQTATADLRGELLNWNGGILASVPVLRKVQRIYTIVKIESTCQISASDISGRTIDMERQTLQAGETLADEINNTIDVVINLKPTLAAVSVINNLPLVGTIIAQFPVAQQYMSKLPETGTQVALLVIDTLTKVGSGLGVVLVGYASPELRDQGQQLVVKGHAALQRGYDALK